MRAIALALLLVAPILVGCLGATTTQTPPAPKLDALPEGAKAVEIPGGVRLLFEGVKLPFERNVTIPAGTTVVRATTVAGATDLVSMTMRNADTQRRRCNFDPVVDAWDAPTQGLAQCSGVAVVDALPAVWIIRGAGPATGTVQVDFLSTPLDGEVAKLDLTQLSMRTYTPEKTKVQMVPSFDGTPLRVEVTTPVGPGPWPVVLWSSPYSTADRATGKPAAWDYFIHDWVERGYAAVAADVRGYGESGGCVEVWGVNEQKDQKFLVDWAAKQPWSDGRVGFYGQSYVATTPVEAAAQNPPALKAIIAVAPVVNAYDDWHFGGVPNGEGPGSAISYQQIGTDDEQNLQDPLTFAVNKGNGVCDPTLHARTNDPRAVYDDFYAIRNFSTAAPRMQAAVLYTHGFEDSNVKSQMIVDWFNAITAPKLGLFGHWVHQHPTRADDELLMLLWLDQYVKGKPVGFEKLPKALVVDNDGNERGADAWPQPGAPETVLATDAAGGKLGAAANGDVQILLDTTQGIESYQPPALAGAAGLPIDLPVPTGVTLTSAPLAQDVRLSGNGVVRLDVTLDGAENGYVAAYLREKDANGTRLVTFGMFNLAHRHGHDKYEPVTPGEEMVVPLPLLPTERVFHAGTTLILEIRGARVTDWDAGRAGEPGLLTIHGGEGKTALVLPGSPDATGMPLTSIR